MESSEHRNSAFIYFWFSLSCAVLLVLCSCQGPLPEEVELAYQDLPEKIDFNFHIRPILSDRCYSCHGPDNNSREANFRIDSEEGAFAKLKNTSGSALVSGDLSKSVAWQRIIADDPELQMPPPESNLSLTTKEKALIAKWIKQGAEWKKHWAFIPPEEPVIPEVDEDKAINPIDNFILAKLKEQDLELSPDAGKERLIRRLSFDLRGLPPSMEEIETFLADESPQAYEKLVDEMLSSDAYAERMTLEWLDVARYADSHGLHADGMREMWPWRDWVITAFKQNLPYDQFVSWQIAGDLFPNATKEQKLATGFHRNHIANSESGIVTEEFRLKYVADRVNTTATAFLGLTMECAACHDHKFDPLSQKEYYEMASFFNNVKELGMLGNDRNFGPVLQLPTPEAEAKLAQLSNQIDTVAAKIALTKTEISSINDFVKDIQPDQIKVPAPVGFYPLDAFREKLNKNGRTDLILDHNQKSVVTGEPELVEGKIGKAVRLDSDYDLVFLDKIENFNLHQAFSAGAWIKLEDEGSFQTIMGNIGDKNTGWRGWTFFLDTLNRPSLKIVHSLSHNYLHIKAEQAIDTAKWTHVFFTYDGSAKAAGANLYMNGQRLSTKILFNSLYKSIKPVRSRSYIPDPGRKIMMGKGRQYLYTDTDDGVFTGGMDQVQIFDQELTTIEVAKLYRTDAKPDETIKFEKEDYLAHYLKRKHEPYQELNRQLKQLNAEKFSLLDSVQEVMVLDEMETPRKTFIQERGQYDAPGEEVFPDVPSAVLPFTEQFPKNRLGLAQWLFDEKNPLTARVAVNRYWQMIFGRGIVETPHDFGSQGALPTHPKLLDYLSVNFQNSGWDLSALLKMMVTSAVYRQSSISTEEHLAKDPYNQLYARGVSYRLPAEMIRDNALAVSGLLSTKIGGASVRPYQPDGLWAEKNEFSGFLRTYVQDTGENLYRKSMYTFIRRTSPPPAMLTFDAPARDVCTVKREKTNTPLQALVLLNDPQFVEAARVLAEKVQSTERASTKGQCQFIFRRLCGRMPNTNEIDLLQEQYQFARKRYEQDPAAAKELLSVGAYPFNSDLNEVETAALATVTSTIMNFDEFYMKR